MPVGRAILCTPVASLRAVPKLFIVPPMVIYRRRHEERRSKTSTSLRESSSNKNLEKDEADHDGLDEKENCVELVITFVLRDGSRHNPNEIKHTADDVYFS